MAQKPPFRRTRDAKKYFKAQQIVSFDEWDEISSKAAEAEEFLNPEKRVYATLEASLIQAQDTILENRVREVREEHTITDTFKKIFITPKKIQDDELVGQLKFIRQFIAELRTWIDFKAELEKKEADGVIHIQRSKNGK